MKFTPALLPFSFTHLSRVVVIDNFATIEQVCHTWILEWRTWNSYLSSGFTLQKTEQLFYVFFFIFTAIEQACETGNDLFNPYMIENYRYSNNFKKFIVIFCPKQSY